MAEQSPVLAALTSPKTYSALAGVALGLVIFLVVAWSMGYLTRPSAEQLAEQALEAQIPEVLSRAKNEAFLAAHAKQTGVTVLPDGLQYRVIKAGTGKKPESASAVVKVNYTGKFIDGTTFDSSEGRGPAEFPLNQVIKGWTEGLQLMQVGEKAEFVIPYDLAYGPEGRQGAIPPYQTLVFEVELLDVK
ncbi:MAG: FKBP-type peptidyl-prolyl cis-trans isomerase [Alphaproteobacteria bacterium]|nr:FKBP-type peptidyl-prolyl cis-trans isomerase [Alphaproteobacteria bacterium]